MMNETQLRRLALGSVAFITLLGTIGSALSPWLLVRQPLLLVALSPDWRHIVLVAAESEFLPVLAVSEPRRAAGLLAMYGMGWFYGLRVVDWFERKVPRLGSFLRWLEELFERLGAPLLIVFPSYTLGALAGAARTRFWVFLPAMLTGQVFYIGASYYFGDAIRDWTKPFLRFLADNLVVSTAVCVALVLGQQLWSRRKGKGPSLDDQ